MNPEPYTVTTVPPLMLPLGGDSNEIWSVRGGTGGGSVDRRASRKDASEKGTPAGRKLPVGRGATGKVVGLES